MGDELGIWLRANLDEDERAACELERVGLDTVMPGAVIDQSGATVFFGPDVYRRLLSVLDPMRMLREVGAKRRILDRYVDALTRTEDVEYSASDALTQIWEYEDFILPALALPYVDRPGYRDEWRP